MSSQPASWVGRIRVVDDGGDYQLLIMVLIAGGTGLGLLFAVLAGARRLTVSRHRLRLDRLVRVEDG